MLELADKVPQNADGREHREAAAWARVLDMTVLAHLQRGELAQAHQVLERRLSMRSAPPVLKSNKALLDGLAAHGGDTTIEDDMLRRTWRDMQDGRRGAPEALRDLLHYIFVLRLRRHDLAGASSLLRAYDLDDPLRETVARLSLPQSTEEPAIHSKSVKPDASLVGVLMGVAMRSRHFDVAEQLYRCAATLPEVVMHGGKGELLAARLRLLTTRGNPATGLRLFDSLQKGETCTNEGIVYRGYSIRPWPHRLIEAVLDAEMAQGRVSAATRRLLDLAEAHELDLTPGLLRSIIRRLGMDVSPAAFDSVVASLRRGRRAPGSQLDASVAVESFPRNKAASSRSGADALSMLNNFKAAEQTVTPELIARIVKAVPWRSTADMNAFIEQELSARGFRRERHVVAASVASVARRDGVQSAHRLLDEAYTAGYVRPSIELYSPIFAAHRHSPRETLGVTLRRISELGLEMSHTGYISLASTWARSGNVSGAWELLRKAEPSLPLSFDSSMDHLIAQPLLVTIMYEALTYAGSMDHAVQFLSRQLDFGLQCDQALGVVARSTKRLWLKRPDRSPASLISRDALASTATLADENLRRISAAYKEKVARQAEEHRKARGTLKPLMSAVARGARTLPRPFQK